METWRLGELETSRVGDLETLRGGELETWRLGELESWRPGVRESWRVGEHETWRAGDFEQGFLSQDSSARNLQKNLFGVTAGIIFLFSEKWLLDLWKPHTADYVAKSSFLFQKNGPS